MPGFQPFRLYYSLFTINCSLFTAHVSLFTPYSLPLTLTLLVCIVIYDIPPHSVGMTLDYNLLYIAFEQHPLPFTPYSLLRYAPLFTDFALLFTNRLYRLNHYSPLSRNKPRQCANNHQHQQRNHTHRKTNLRVFKKLIALA